MKKILLLLCLLLLAASCARQTTKKPDEIRKSREKPYATCKEEMRCAIYIK
jgi:hypothetical protein